MHFPAGPSSPFKNVRVAHVHVHVSIRSVWGLCLRDGDVCVTRTVSREVDPGSSRQPMVKSVSFHTVPLLVAVSKNPSRTRRNHSMVSVSGLPGAQRGKISKEPAINPYVTSSRRSRTLGAWIGPTLMSQIPDIHMPACSHFQDAVPGRQVLG